jgi:DNA gyrase subunit B
MDGSQPLKEEENEYNASSIKVLEGLEAVRKRPDMYIGSVPICPPAITSFPRCSTTPSTSGGRLVQEYPRAPLCRRSVSVLDDGRGIPVEEHETGKSALEVVMTSSTREENSTTKVTRSLADSTRGRVVVCALSERMEVDVYREGVNYRQEYRRGGPPARRPLGKTDKRGTKVKFKPDSQIFPVLEFQYDA